MEPASAAERDHSHPPANPDVLGQVLSAACAVHCVATPAAVVLAPAAASALGGAHPVLFAVVLVVGLWAFIPGYRRHRDWRVPATAAFGLTALGLAAFPFHGNPVVDTALSLVGAAAMMLAHWRNRVARRQAHRPAR